MYFAQLKISEPILKAITELNYVDPTPIQIEAIPPLLEGHDLLGTAQTGTGKTAAFAIPLLQKIITNRPTYQSPTLTSLVVAPTRELAAQIGTSIKQYAKYAKVKVSVVFGGMAKGPQIHNLRSGTDILVATPGRLLDLANGKFVDLSNVNYFVLDEADQMLDMGFLPDIKKIISKLPEKRQTMLFSATMPKEILSLSGSLLNHPVRISIGSVQHPLDAISQSLYRVSKENKAELLIHLLKDETISSALVFCRTKNGANRLTKKLSAQPYQTEVIHGNKSQNARTAALKSFKAHESRVMIATDIAARGLDISQISHVINYDMPQTPETYLHRMGRTGRAGEAGITISFCSRDELSLLKDVQKHIGMDIPVVNSPITFTNKESAEQAPQANKAKPAARPQTAYGKPKDNHKPHSSGDSSRNQMKQSNHDHSQSSSRSSSSGYNDKNRYHGFKKTKKPY
ncbi:MAG: DEAD/DEAH box helicase [Bacteroidia bacterium]|nr:DEAD/DEAH box helicase [Bacteroidia bacterium]